MHGCAGRGLPNTWLHNSDFFSVFKCLFSEQYGCKKPQLATRHQWECHLFHQDRRKTFLMCARWKNNISHMPQKNNELVPKCHSTWVMEGGISAEGSCWKQLSSCPHLVFLFRESKPAVLSLGSKSREPRGVCNGDVFAHHWDLAREEWWSCLLLMFCDIVSIPWTPQKREQVWAAFTYGLCPLLQEEFSHWKNQRNHERRHRFCLFFFKCWRNEKDHLPQASTPTAGLVHKNWY